MSATSEAAELWGIPAENVAVTSFVNDFRGVCFVATNNLDVRVIEGDYVAGQDDEALRRALANLREKIARQMLEKIRG